MLLHSERPDDAFVPVAGALREVAVGDSFPD